VINRDENRDLSLVGGRGGRHVGAPNLVWAFGDDRAVVRLGAVGIADPLRACGPRSRISRRTCSFEVRMPRGRAAAGPCGTPRRGTTTRSGSVGCGRPAPHRSGGRAASSPGLRLLLDRGRRPTPAKIDGRAGRFDVLKVALRRRHLECPGPLRVRLPKFDSVGSEAFGVVQGKAQFDHDVWVEDVFLRSC
jgi:hypothetical protein